MLGKIVAGEQQDLPLGGILCRKPQNLASALRIAMDQGIIEKKRRPRVGKERLQIGQFPQCSPCCRGEPPAGISSAPGSSNGCLRRLTTPPQLFQTYHAGEGDKDWNAPYYWRKSGSGRPASRPGGISL